MTKRAWSHLRSGLFTAGAVLTGVLGCAIWAQQPASPVNVNLVLLDPAHGGPDPGAHLNGNVAEKDVTLAFSGRLRTALAAKGFIVLATREGDTGVTSIQRAEVANHAHPLACLLLHATSSGSGIYLAASSLAPEVEQRPVLPWESAQATFIPLSLSLLDAIVRSVTAISVKPVVLRASVPPIDSLTCPTVLVEMAPLSGRAVTEEGYQQKVAEGLVDALVAWRNQETLVKTPRADAPAGDTESGAGGISVPAKPRPKVATPTPSATTTAEPAGSAVLQ